MSTFVTTKTRPRRRTLLPVALITLLTLAGCGDSGDNSGGEPEGSAEQQSQQAPQGEDTITMEQLQENDDADSCWASIEGTVYDLTEWISAHPGGPSRIEQLCGTDATGAFQAQHGGQPRPEQQLAEFAIGVLED